MPRKKPEESYAILSDRSMQRHSKLRAHWLMALVEGEGVLAEREVCILVPPGIAASPSLFYL